MRFAWARTTDPDTWTWAYEGSKRLLDVTVSFVALLLLSPVLLACALAVRLSSPGPVIFRQVRIGEGSRPFEMYKFRSMLAESPSEAHERHMRRLILGELPPMATYKLRDDPRITPVGRVLRRTSLDELPQLVNVLLGDMSLVGPRPALPYEVAEYDSHQRGRLAVKPGLTGLWQVNGRARRTFAEQVDLDLAYVARRSLLLDLAILLQTPLAVLKGDGSG